MKALRGVNLGGWLVLERWMTPSVFSDSRATDELTLSKECPDRIKKHHATFISEKDFAWIAKAGLGAIRIPIGYWIFGDEPPFVGSIDRLDFAFVMAEKYKLQVVISLHGAPGSQNGKRHSGQERRVSWHWDKQAKLKTLEITKRLAVRYGTHPQLWGIELLNEPTGGLLKNFVLRKYYKAAYSTIRKQCREQVKVIISDSFRPQTWKKFMRSPAYTGVVMDTHLYHCFSPIDKRLNIEAHLQKALERRRSIANWQRHLPVMIGEWSLAVGGKNSFTSEQSQKKQQLLSRFAANQIKSYDTAAAWFFWSYKMEHANNWNFRHLVESGTIDLA